MIGVCLSILAALAAAAPAAGARPGFGADSAGDLHFGAARLGMTLSQWKALPPPPGSAAGAVASCTGEAARAAGGRPVVVCTYADRLRSYVLPQDYRLSKAYLARDPTFTFVSGRLARIDFQSSIDAFDALVADFRSQLGAPSRTVHDQVMLAHGRTRARVQFLWRLRHGTVRITDPAGRPDQLAVDFASAAGAGQTPTG